MAKQIGVFKFKGKLGDFAGSTRKTKSGKAKESIVGIAGGVDGDTIKNSPEFVRTRENMSEFERAGSLAKLIRQGHVATFKSTRVPLLASRMTKLVRDIIGKDAINVRGERTVTAPNFGEVAGYKVNELVNLDSILGFGLDVSFTSPNVSLDIPSFTPITEVNPDPASDVMRIGFSACAIDVASGVITGKGEAGTAFIDISQATATTAQTLNADLTGASAGDWVVVSVSVAFAQSVNGANYPLKNDSYIPIEIVQGLAFA